MMPPLVIGLLLIFLIGPEGTLGNLLANIHLTGVNTFFALIAAEFYEAAPFYVLGAHAAFASVDPRIEQDATLLGDRPLQAFARITLPLAAPGLATGLATAWARAMGAFGAVVIIAYYPRGLPNQIFIAFQEFGLSGALRSRCCSSWPHSPSRFSPISGARRTRARASRETRHRERHAGSTSRGRPRSGT